MEIDISLIQEDLDGTGKKMIETILGTSAEEIVAEFTMIQVIKMIQHSLKYTLKQIEDDRMERANTMAASLTRSQGDKK